MPWLEDSISQFFLSSLPQYSLSLGGGGVNIGIPLRAEHPVNSSLHFFTSCFLSWGSHLQGPQLLWMLSGRSEPGDWHQAVRAAFTLTPSALSFCLLGGGCLAPPQPVAPLRMTLLCIAGFFESPQPSFLWFFQDRGLQEFSIVTTGSACGVPLIAYILINGFFIFAFSHNSHFWSICTMYFLEVLSHILWQSCLKMYPCYRVLGS